MYSTETERALFKKSCLFIFSDSFDPCKVRFLEHESSPGGNMSVQVFIYRVNHKV